MQSSGEKITFGQTFGSPSNLTRFSLLLALGIALQTLDNFISPFFIPGFKIGLAHLATLFSLIYFTGPVVLLLIVLRVALGSLLLGLLFSPAFYLSFFASIASGLAMIFIFIFFRRHLSYLGVSLVGSFFHNFFQLITACLLLNNWVLLGYLPWFSFLGIVAGLINGLIANYLGRRFLLLLMNAELS